MKWCVRKTLFTQLFLMATICVSNVQAIEVITHQIDRKLPMVKVGVFASKSNAKNVVKKLMQEYDVYTGELKGHYYLYVVNIDPHEKYEALLSAKEINYDAFFVQKSEFKYGVYLFESESKKSEIKKDKENFVPLQVKREEYYVDEKLKVDLIDVVHQTLSNSYKIKAARERVIQAKRDIDIAYADYKPTVDVAYTLGTKRREPGEQQEDQTLAPYSNFMDQSYSLNLKQNIYAGGASSAKIQKMQKSYLMAKNDYEGLLENETLKAVTAYFDIVFRRESLVASENNIEKLETILEITQSKFDSGALSIGELSSVEASISNSKTQLSRVKSRYNNALEYYRYIVGKNFRDTYPYQKDLSVALDDYEVVLDKAFQNNNKIKGFEHKIAAKKSMLKEKRSQFSPKLDLLLSAEQKEDEEFDRFDGNRYTARLNLNYNLYNGGRDTAEYLKAYSSIIEDDYERESQVREMIWNLEKLYSSLLSLQESIESIKSELEASDTMVESYWERFRYGEQELYTLLQAQKQLNTAELDLIESEQNNLIDYFKVLQISGELLEYFSINADESTFLDMAQSKYNERIRGASLQKDEDSYFPLLAEGSFSDANESVSQTQEDKGQKESEESKIKEETKEPQSESLENMLSFKELFLMQEREKYTLLFEDFADIYEAMAFIRSNDIASESFVYKKLRNEKVRIDVAYSIFDTAQEANATLASQEFSKDAKVTTLPKKVGEVQESLFAFDQLELVDKKSIKPIIIEKEIKKEPFKTDSAFKRAFLNADENFYTLNVHTFKTLEDAQRAVERGGYKKSAFVFSYGEDIKLYKLMYGVYESYEEAQKALKESSSLQSYMPVIEKVKLKQRLYKRYH